MSEGRDEQEAWQDATRCAALGYPNRTVGPITCQLPKGHAGEHGAWQYAETQTGAEHLWNNESPGFSRKVPDTPALRDEQEAWTMVNKIAGLIEERDSLKERVAFLVAEAHGWQPRLDALVADLRATEKLATDERERRIAAEAEVARLREALERVDSELDGINVDAAQRIARAALATPTKEEGT